MSISIVIWWCLNPSRHDFHWHQIVPNNLKLFYLVNDINIYQTKTKKYTVDQYMIEAMRSYEWVGNPCVHNYCIYLLTYSLLYLYKPTWYPKEDDVTSWKPTRILAYHSTMQTNYFHLFLTRLSSSDTYFQKTFWIP